MQPFLIAGSAALLGLTLCFFSIGTSIIIRVKKPRATWATFWFIMSALTLASYAFLWQLALGRISLVSTSINTVEPVNISPVWLSALGTLSLAAMTFYLSVVKPLLEKPSLKIEFENNNRPFCIKDPPGQGQILWLRVKVTNSGRSTAKNCLGRIVQFLDDKGNPIVDHDPVQLHWVGTLWVTVPELLTQLNLHILDLQKGRSEFLDMLVMRHGYDRALLFMSSDNLFSASPDEVPEGTRTIQVTVYGDNVDPSTKKYSIDYGQSYDGIKLTEKK